jgi:hypothetical protein
MRRSLTLSLLGAPLFTVLAALSWSACAEQSDDDAPITKVDSGSGDAADTGKGDGAADTTPQPDAGGGDAASGSVAINEMLASNGDWIELVNISTKSVDLAGWTLTGLKNDDASAPNVYTFPAGTTLAPGEHFLIVAKDNDAGTDLSTSCLDAGVSHCAHVTWGISDKSGTTLTLKRGDSTVSDEYAYPPGATPAGDSWGRLPDGTGSFKAGKPTPGATNAAP